MNVKVYANEVGQNLKEWGPNFRKQCTVVGGLCAGAISSFIMNTGFCSDGGAAKNVLQKVLGVLCDVFLYVGVLLLCWGVGQLVMAFKNEDADSKSRAIMLIVSSAFLIGIKTFLNTILAATGSGITIEG